MIKSQQKGFTLVELLVASFIFASLLGVVYGILTSVLKSRKELELTVVLGQTSKNITETIRSTVREANGDFFADSDFWPAAIDRRVNLFMASESFLDPANTQESDAVLTRIRQVLNHSARGSYLYVKNGEAGRISVFWLDDSGSLGKLKLKKWIKEESGGRTIWREESSEWSVLAEFDKSEDYYFQVAAKGDSDPEIWTARSVYNPETEIRPFDLWAKMELTLVKQWGRKKYWRHLEQVYVPLLKSNPYL